LSWDISSPLGALSSLKAVAKSDEAIVNAYPAIKSLVA